MYFLLKTFRLRDMASFSCRNDRLRSFLTKNTPMVLDTIRNGIVYEPLARNDDYLQLERRSLTVLASRLDSFLLIQRSYDHDISLWLSSWPNYKCCAGAVSSYYTSLVPRLSWGRIALRAHVPTLTNKHGKLFFTRKSYYHWLAMVSIRFNKVTQA